MAIYRISGNILQDNLQRGANLSIQGNLAYFDVTDNKVGVLTSTPTETLTVAGNLSASNVKVSGLQGNALVYTYANKWLASTSNLSFDGNTLILTGNAKIGNISIGNTTISSNANLTINTTTGNLVFNVLSNGITQFNSTSSLTLPTGNTAQRPASPDVGTIRFNTNDLTVEVWTGSAWKPVGQDFVQITNQIINGDGVTTVFTLDQTTTEAAIIVATNGVLQFPGYAYTVAGNLITFAEAPQVSDQIDVRFTSAVSTVSAITNVSGNAEIQVTTLGVANIASCDSLQLPTYTVAQAANISSPTAGQIIYVSNGDTGNPCLAVYSGGGWKRVSLGANIST